MELILSILLKLGVNFGVLSLLSLLLGGLVGMENFWLFFAFVFFVVTVVEAVRFLIMANRRKSAALSVIKSAQDAVFLADELHEDYRNNIRKPFNNLTDHDYIVSSGITAVTILIAWILQYQVIGFDSVWLSVPIAFGAAVVLGTVMGLKLNFAANYLHQRVFRRIEKSGRPLLQQLRDSWLITEDKLSFKVKDARFETLFGLDGLTPDSLSSMMLIVDIDRREKMIKILQRVKDPRAVETLCAFLEKKPVIDSLVVTALAKIGQRSLNPIRNLLKSGKDQVRLAAMNVLAGINSPEAIDALVHLLDDPSVEVRRAAIWDLKENDSKWMLRDEAQDTLGILKDELQEEEPGNRAFAAWALGMTKNCYALPALRQALKDPFAEVRENAAFAIGEIQDPTAGDALEQALNDEDASVRKSALTALRKIDPERASALSRFRQNQ